VVGHVSFITSTSRAVHVLSVDALSLLQDVDQSVFYALVEDEVGNLCEFLDIDD